MFTITIVFNGGFILLLGILQWADVEWLKPLKVTEAPWPW